MQVVNIVLVHNLNVKVIEQVSVIVLADILVEIIFFRTAMCRNIKDCTTKL